MRLDLSNPNQRAADLRSIGSTVLHSLLGRANAVIHCMTGLCHGPFGAALISALLHSEHIRTSMYRIEHLWNTQQGVAWSWVGGSWAVKASSWNLALPRYPVGFAFERQESAVAHAVRRVDGELIPLCRWNRIGASSFEREPFFVDSLSHECEACLPVSSQLAVESTFGS